MAIMPFRREAIPVVVLAIVAATRTCSAQPDAAKAFFGGHAVTRTAHADSKSIVLRSTHILLVEVITGMEGAWVPSRPGLKSRKVDLSLHVSEMLLGKLDPVPDRPVRIAVTQSDYDGELMMRPLPGAWSGVPLLPRTALVVFSHTDEVRPERVLAEPACTRVVPAEPVLPGLRIAAQAETADLPLSRTLALAAPETARLDSTFAEFLCAKYGDRAMASQSEFNLLADFAERKGLDARARQALLKGAYDLVGLHGEATPERAQRIALAMCRVLLMPEAAVLHKNLIGTYLPNLLGLTSNLPPQAPSTVFKGHEADRQALEAFLQQHGTEAGAAALLTWLSAK
jgi:hypothetical protein